ncbi:putative PurR-regulated permease PerM [Breoghania corrubedonensis]|uniref:Putative PurR-regulated permease PerM n=1 Tax=Breoghania corrubedonensis TaxID=665038 RepID=A0A2T5VGP8_9HYPH|nr:AI-2E family transporter [Breoghania corrubedonensis]PTW62933.1 putative PurR-regulated permease PerM [Breoghania corrubedonensis]
MQSTQPPRRGVRHTDFEATIRTGARLSMIVLGCIVTVAVLDLAQMILAPIALAIIIGLMLGPLADRIEWLGIPPWISAAAIVVLFIALIAAAMTGFAVPLSDWLDKLPAMWQKLQSGLTHWQGVIASIAGLGEKLRHALGQEAAMRVNVEGESTVESVAYLAPAIVAQVLLFLAGLYFYIATRKRFRLSVLSLCFSRRLRWRVAHAFRDIEMLVSRYLLSITAVNIALGVVVSLAMWGLGVPSPLLWGLLAGVLNYVIYIGPAIMAFLLFGVGLASYPSLVGALIPPGVYLLVNLTEAQFVTPHVLGRTMTLNPFVVFLSIAFWIWLWGPIGGFIAVPCLLIVYAIISNILPVGTGAGEPKRKAVR